MKWYRITDNARGEIERGEWGDGVDPHDLAPLRDPETGDRVRIRFRRRESYVRLELGSSQPGIHEPDPEVAGRFARWLRSRAELLESSDPTVPRRNPGAVRVFRRVADEIEADFGP